MTNIEKYNQAFMEAFGTDETELQELHYKGIPAWDSVGQMTLIATIEDTFGFVFEPGDIMKLNSYAEGKKILENNYGILF